MWCPAHGGVVTPTLLVETLIAISNYCNAVHRWMHAIIFVRLQEHLADSENMLL